MKSILSVIGAFLFTVFVEGFIRVIIVFYHGYPFELFGVSELPSISWVVIILISQFVIYWLAGMLTITINNLHPYKHLGALFLILFSWRLNDALQSEFVNSVYYLFSFILLISAMAACHLIHKTSHEVSSV